MQELMAELRVRLGFVSTGTAAQTNSPIMTSFLQEAHDFVYQELAPASERAKAVILLKKDQALYDWNDDGLKIPIEPGYVQKVWLRRTPSDRYEMRQGITEYDRQLDATLRQWPEKYDHLFGQIEVWPIPDQSYEMVVEYLTGKPRFSQPTDRPGVPDRLVLLYAIALGKAHYRHPDASTVAGSFQTLMRAEKFKQHEGRRYFAAVHEPTEPQVVRTAEGGYQLRVR